MVKPKGVNDQNPFILHQNSANNAHLFSKNTSPEQEKSEQAKKGTGGTSQFSEKSGATATTIDAAKLLDMNEAAEVIEQLGLIDLRALNKLIVDRINSITESVHEFVLSQFKPGNRVRFKSKDGTNKTGTIIRVNQKTVSLVVDGDDHAWWKVSPQILERI